MTALRAHERGSSLLLTQVETRWGPLKTANRPGPGPVLTPHTGEPHRDEHFLELPNLALERIYNFLFAVTEFDLESQRVCLPENTSYLAYWTASRGVQSWSGVHDGPSKATL